MDLSQYRDASWISSSRPPWEPATPVDHSQVAPFGLPPPTDNPPREDARGRRRSLPRLGGVVDGGRSSYLDEEVRGPRDPVSSSSGEVGFGRSLEVVRIFVRLFPAVAASFLLGGGLLWGTAMLCLNRNVGGRGSARLGAGVTHPLS